LRARPSVQGFVDRQFTTLRGFNMRKLRTAVALAAALAMAGCQTLDGVTVNGVDVNKEVQEAQDGGILGNCGIICAAAIAAGLIVGSALIFDWPFSFDDDDEDNDTSD
jgi:hypothetical protein